MSDGFSSSGKRKPIQRTTHGGGYEEFMAFLAKHPDAAVQGDGQATHNQGICYQFERGVGHSMKRAVDWFEACLALIDNPELARKAEIIRSMPDLGLDESEADLPEGHETAPAATWAKSRERPRKRIRDSNCCTRQNRR